MLTCSVLFSRSSQILFCKPATFDTRPTDEALPKVREQRSFLHLRRSPLGIIPDAAELNCQGIDQCVPPTWRTHSCPAVIEFSRQVALQATWMAGVTEYNTKSAFSYIRTGHPIRDGICEEPLLYEGSTST